MSSDTARLGHNERLVVELPFQYIGEWPQTYASFAPVLNTAATIFQNLGASTSSDSHYAKVYADVEQLHTQRGSGHVVHKRTIDQIYDFVNGEAVEFQSTYSQTTVPSDNSRESLSPFFETVIQVSEKDSLHDGYRKFQEGDSIIAHCRVKLLDLDEYNSASPIAWKNRCPHRPDRTV